MDADLHDEALARLILYVMVGEATVSPRPPAEFYGIRKPWAWCVGLGGRAAVNVLLACDYAVIVRQPYAPAIRGGETESEVRRFDDVALTPRGKGRGVELVEACGGYHESAVTSIVAQRVIAHLKSPGDGKP